MRRCLLLATLSAAFATTAAPALACPGSPDPCPYHAVQQFGTTNGVLEFPQAIAAAPDGTLLVPDGFDYKVSRFASSGQFLASYGTPSLSLLPPDGTSSGASGVAVDPATGNYYILDNEHNRVEEFSPAGTFLHRAGRADGTTGGGVGEFALDGAAGTNGGIAVANGFVYVADGGNTRIQRLSLTLTGAAVLSGSSFVGHPTGIQVAGGVLWVTDHESSAANNRIIRYALSGTTLSSPTIATVAFADPLAYDAASNTLYTTALGVDKLNATTLATPATPVVPDGRGPGQTNEPLSITLLAGGDFVVAQGDDALKRFTAAGAQVWTAGVNEHAGSVVMAPDGLSVTPTGDVLVSAESAEQVTRFNPSAQFVSRFGSSFSDPAGNWLPQSAAQGPDGTVWVGDIAGRVIHFGADGSYLGDAAGDVSSGTLAVDGHGQIDELGLATEAVRRFDAAGNLLGSFGSAGSGPGQMTGARRIAAAPDGTIAIADQGNHRVDLFAANGTFLRSFGSTGSGNGQFQSLIDVALDGQGHVFALDSNLDRVQEFALDGTFLGVWGTFGPGDGQFFNPASIAADAAGNVYVGDTSQHRVQEFVIATPPTSAAPIAPPVPPVTPAKAAKLKIRVSTAIHLKTLLNHGIDVRLSSDQPGKATLTLTLGASDAHKLGLRAVAAKAKPKPKKKVSAKPVTIGTATASYTTARTRTITLKLSLKAKVKLKHLKLNRHQSKRLTLTIAFRTTGHKTTTAKKTIKLER